MIIWSSYVILVLGLGAAVGLILLEIRLASFDKPWVGLLPLVLLVVVAILSNLAVIMVYGGDEVKELTVDMRGGNTAPVSYTHLRNFRYPSGRPLQRLYLRR